MQLELRNTLLIGTEDLVAKNLILGGFYSLGQISDTNTCPAFQSTKQLELGKR